MPAENRIKYFEYVVKGLLQWHNEVVRTPNNDLSRLKTLKLLFFVSAVKSGEDSSLIENVFNEFVAMPYGHVESKVYSELVRRNGNLDYYIIDNKCTLKKTDANINELDNDQDLIYKPLIDESIAILKEINPDLIRLSAFNLVDISHSWYSWKNNYSRNYSKSVVIPIEEIKAENKVFSMQFV